MIRSFASWLRGGLIVGAVVLVYLGVEWIIHHV